MDFPSRMVQLRDNSFVDTMMVDPETFMHFPSQSMREVKSGNYVPVLPTPLPSPKLVLHSPEMAAMLGLSEAHCASKEFARFFSGDISAVPESVGWATPYALSIYGNFQQNRQCPFKNGNGYGDGRAISVQEVLHDGRRWELQLKGGGKTPFCRGADGRAVLRSSIREFLVSEAMHHLGVGTTRALSLVVSQAETTRRPVPEEDETGTQSESCAITCRVARSFLRIGHFEVFGRRVANPPRGCKLAEEHVRCLEMLVDHALQREFGCDPARPWAESMGVSKDGKLADRAWAVLSQTAERVAGMTAQWLRVGFCQGNFNADNCLISGCTMDYGPFGFVEAYDPNFGSWVGSGQHFAFMNQPQAGMMNLFSLTQALVPLLDEDEDQVWDKVKALYLQASENAKAEVWRQKLGLAEWSLDAAGLLSDLLRLMQECRADWTITWRQLGACLEVSSDMGEEVLWKAMVSHQSHLQAHKGKWLPWLKQWLNLVDGSGSSRATAAKTIRAVSPKYVPREWMLKDAYAAAQQGDYSLTHKLFALFKQPYAEQQECEMKYYVSKPTVSIS